MPFPDLFFFIPQVIIRLDENNLRVGSLQEDHEQIFNDILSVEEDHASSVSAPVKLCETISRQDYLKRLEQVKAHILRGDCYELNYCIEFIAEDARVNPLGLYEQLASISPNPFAAYYRIGDLYLLCASPERYIARQGDKIFSQPIKGTVKRNKEDLQEDNRLKIYLTESTKEKSENVMVVDLVRNDLSRVCLPASVQVEELFGVYTFPHLHHMISTVSGHLREGIQFSDIIRATFPMGSMTGAPKKRVLELIDRYEPTARGIFSGALGYITPEGDFDFNVVIRSIAYDQSTKHLSYHVGSGITGYADTEREYEECLLKAGAISQVLS
ncbi:MAG: chorismate-binding protein [Bacteroidota bacterium]